MKLIHGIVRNTLTCKEFDQSKHEAPNCN